MILLGILFEVSELLELDMEFGVVEQIPTSLNFFRLFVEGFHFFDGFPLLNDDLLNFLVEGFVLFLQQVFEGVKLIDCAAKVDLFS